ncbi:MAG: hypothetical protein DRR19_11465 [Candidatus Parabeggiatoa sp. nov. 1]|nr:MAG: hypothetical protein DRR19_11465 [Gammaproteobacteria bacterium]
MIPISFSKLILEKLRQKRQVAYERDSIESYRMIQALIWYGEGQPVSEIALFLQVTTKTIYNWIKLFICNVFSWLFRHMYVGRGRKSKLTKAQKSELYKMIESGPEACGFECGVWNTALIASSLLLKFGVKYNPRYYRAS